MEMENNIIENNSFSSSRQKILEEIKRMGFEVQNQQLIEKGFTKYSQNLKYLKLHQGDVNTILEALSTKKPKKNHRDELESNIKGQEPNACTTKIEKKPKYDYKKHTRKEGKESKAEFLKSYESWPEGIARVYLDGNNMLFVDDSIRKLCLSRQKGKAEECLAKIAAKFGEFLNAKETILIFDSTKRTSQSKINTKGGPGDFKVISASPGFSTSDDALVSFSEQFDAEDKKNSIFVTSDRGLQIRLNENGVENIVKTGKWFNFAKETIGEEVYKQLIN